MMQVVGKLHFFSEIFGNSEIPSQISTLSFPKFLPKLQSRFFYLGGRLRITYRASENYF